MAGEKITNRVLQAAETMAEIDPRSAQAVGAVQALWSEQSGTRYPETGEVSVSALQSLLQQQSA